MRTRWGLVLLLATAVTWADTQSTGSMRIEHDLLGEKAIPAQALYGVQTARALENFQISNLKLSDYPELVDGYVYTKMAAARANAVNQFRLYECAPIGEGTHDRGNL